ncbi:hypothetical protein EDD90_10460 [Streptomyces sp. Ag109_O5-1]|nr:hypothetical protein EDD90_10460 [Streptomyces sp. Ag109_O5-1]
MTGTALADHFGQRRDRGPYLVPFLALVDDFECLGSRQTHGKREAVEGGALIRDGSPGLLLRGADPVSSQREGGCLLQHDPPQDRVR